MAYREIAIQRLNEIVQEINPQLRAWTFNIDSEEFGSGIEACHEFVQVQWIDGGRLGGSHYEVALLTVEAKYAHGPYFSAQDINLGKNLRQAALKLFDLRDSMRRKHHMSKKAQEQS